jgi:hypothetical protein
MSNAYVIEVGSRTAGIVAKDERGYRFFSSDRIFDSLEGREFSTARDAERAARALFLERRIWSANNCSLPFDGRLRKLSMNRKSI